jgi:serine/threonine protein kinase
VLVNDKGIAQLCDFGLVYLLDWEGDAMNTTSPYSATPKYQAPELFNTRSNRVTKPSAAGDVYAFGCIIYEVSVAIFLERYRTCEPL